MAPVNESCCEVRGYGEVVGKQPKAIIAISVILGAALAVPVATTIALWNDLPEFIATLSDVEGNATSWMAKGPAVATLCGGILIFGVIAWGFAYTDDGGHRLFPAVSAVDVFAAVLISGLGTEILRVQATTDLYAPTTLGIVASVASAAILAAGVFFLLITKPLNRDA